MPQYLISMRYLNHKLIIKVRSSTALKVPEPKRPLTWIHYKQSFIAPLTNIINEITHHLNTSPYMLNGLQFGFRKPHSTEAAVCYFLETIKSKLVFLDLSKAFDTVNHKLLITKLTRFNFSEKSLKWMESYLSSRLQCVRVQNTKSTPCDNNLGVPQGSILGPLLFSLFINDLASYCPPTVTCQLYADALCTH